MEVTYGLLSNLVKTKSIQRVLAPIASQISLLIILHESELKGEGGGAPSKMATCATSVMEAAETLTVVAKHRADTSPDQDFRAQMGGACEILDLASGNLCIAAQRLEVEYTNQEARSKLIQSAKDVLQGTMKVLLVSDDAEVRRLIAAANLVTEKVDILNKVTSMTDLLANFKSFTDAATLLTSLANKRQKDLTMGRQREKILTSLNMLKKSVPAISIALQNFIKYPSNTQAETSKSYVTGQVKDAVEDIVDAVQNKLTEGDDLDMDEASSFVSKIDQAMDALSEDSRLQLNPDLESWTESVVRHSMAVAHMCSDAYRDLIIKTCGRIEKLRFLIDLTVERWMDPAERICDVALSKNKDFVKVEVDCLKEHQHEISKLVILTEGMKSENLPSCHEKLVLLREQKNDLENITVTIASTAEMFLLSGMKEERSQLEQLGREWAVLMYCMVFNLDSLVQEVYAIGQEQQLWYQADEKDPLLYLQKQNERYRVMLRAVCQGENQGGISTSVPKEMQELFYDIKTISQGQPFPSHPVKSSAVVYFRPKKLSLTKALWIMKGLEGLRLIKEQCALFFQPLDCLIQVANSIRQATTEIERSTKRSEFQMVISKFSEDFTVLRQKLLNRLQMSVELSKRGTVRQCLDDLTALSPKAIDVIKNFAEPPRQTYGQVEMYSFVGWSSLFRSCILQLLIILSLMPCLPTLFHRLCSYLGLFHSVSGACSLLLSLFTKYCTLQVSYYSFLSCLRQKKQDNSYHSFLPASATFHFRSTIPKLLDLEYDPSTSVLAAARYLEREADRWEDENNPIVQVAKEMTQQMEIMSEHCVGEGTLMGHNQMIEIAKAAALNGQKILRFAEILAEHCVDKRFADDLMFYAGQIPMISTQLNILATVQMTSPEERTAEKVLVLNAQNLMKIVVQTVHAAEAVCVKGLHPPLEGQLDEMNVYLLATQWKEKLSQYRNKESLDAEIDELGLRRIEEDTPPTLTQIFQTS
ncbi:hypothetical protein ScPMuIL_000305 [Solemya velum]